MIDAVLTVDASGAVRHIVVDVPPAYQGSRECLLGRLRSFDFPALDEPGETQVRFTFARPGHDDGSGRILDLACQARDDAKMQRQAAKFFGLSYWAHPAHLAWMAWAQNRKGWSDLIPTILVARLFQSAGLSLEARRTLSEVASACPAVADHFARIWGFPDDASAFTQLAAEDRRTEPHTMCWDPPPRAGHVGYLCQFCPALAKCLNLQ
jgi:hypothetical protein